MPGESIKEGMTRPLPFLAACAFAVLLTAASASAQIRIQPISEATSNDAKIYSSVPTSNFASNLNVTSLDTGAHFLALVQFDLSQLGALNADAIVSATFTLYCTGLGVSGAGAVGGDVTVSPILNAWKENTDDIAPAGAPLATYDAFFGTTPTISFGPSVASQNVTGAGFYSWDITSTVKAWQSGSLPNNGLFIQLSSAGGDIGFADVDSNLTIAGSAPSLTVVPEPATASLLLGAGLFLISRRRRTAAGTFVS
ncbi:MAG: hypothetical protein JWL59_1985 [Chthoniobacteraceae bacterium]|nr:hypothetical protein [Chthoniobacteraceae bacterium]